VPYLGGLMLNTGLTSSTTYSEVTLSQPFVARAIRFKWDRRKDNGGGSCYYSESTTLTGDELCKMYVRMDLKV